jgi:hypothetical protein
MGIDRRESFGFDSLVDEDYDNKKQLLEKQIQATEGLRQAGDLMVAAFFAKTKPKERAEKQQVYLAMLSGAFQDDGLSESVQEIRERLASGEKGISPFHWDLEFPEVFSEERGGFDAFVGNPPFLGGSRISEENGIQYFQYIGYKYKPSLKHCDLSGYFFRQCFSLLRENGTCSLIATNTISQGDSRESSLEYIALNGGLIFGSRKRYPWPGAAAVIVSIVYIIKSETYKGRRFIDKADASRISSFLIESDIETKPSPLTSSLPYSLGSKIYGQGFLFADGDEACTPISRMREILADYPECADRIKPYIGGEDVNQRPLQDTDRYCIFLSDIKDEEGLERYPALLDIVKKKVYPERMRLGDNPNNIPLKRRWWAYQAHRPELYLAIEEQKLEKVIVCSQVSTHLQFAFIRSDQIFSQKLVVIPTDDWLYFGILQSRLHEVWARLFSSTMKDDLNYSPSDCLSNFPLPTGSSNEEKVRDAARDYYDLRHRLASSSCLTSVSNEINDPSCSSPNIKALRILLSNLDTAVADLYSLGGVMLGSYFTLAYLPTVDEVDMPASISEALSEGIPYWKSEVEALDFNSQWEAAFGKSKRLPWRYRWSDDVRDEVLARLLALNAERYEEELRLGLHRKGGRAAARGGSSQQIGLL